MSLGTGRNVAYRYRGEEDSKYHVKHALAIFTVASSSFTHISMCPDLVER